MMNCNWIVRDTEEKRQQCYDVLRKMYANDLEAQILNIHEAGQWNRDEVVALWKHYKEVGHFNG